MAMIVDARGLACPQPVVLTNNAFGESDEVTTIVDNEVSKENVARLAKTKGFSCNIEKKDGDFYLLLRRENTIAEESDNLHASGLTVLVIGSDTIGQGSEELGRKLMTSFIQVLHEISPRPDTIIFINSGVKLAVEGSQVIEDLREMEETGTLLLACGTCLGFFDLKDKLRVGQISNMYDIASAMFGAERLINP